MIPVGSRTSLRRRLAAMFAVVGLVVGLSSLGALVSTLRLLDARRDLVDRIDPAAASARELLAAYVDQETGVRGFVLAPRDALLDPLRAGQADELDAEARLERLLAGDDELWATLLAAEGAADVWKAQYAEPALAAARALDQRFASDQALIDAKVLFDDVRGGLDDLQDQLADRRDTAVERLDAATSVLIGVLVASGLGAALSGLVLWWGLRRWVVSPLHQLVTDAGVVSEGDLDHPVAVTGPRELIELGEAVEAMRLRMVAELAEVEEARAQLDASVRDLARSNTELEQFAYVASHDLQEPLRKVASFCQLLERRYKGQLDEQADQYIAFAVDGAKRMQKLINDLLAFSRVGRVSDELRPVELDVVIRQALDNLSTAIAEAGATVQVPPMPTVAGDPSLLTALFQNLVANSVKFRTEDAPVIELDVERDGERWRFSATDNGIGIEPRFAERVFVIFQRLHPKDVYEGTGIGLALCRKIASYHGGEMWIDTEHVGGARICWTLPALPEEAPAP